MAIQYDIPSSFLSYDKLAITDALTEAKANVLALTSMPYQRAWAENLQEIELKREVAGTSKIEGADFTEQELNEAISEDADGKGMTRSQRQARAAMIAYRWLSGLKSDVPVTVNLVKEIHSRMITDCDDDHCAPGRLRSSGQNVIFGRPKHRGAEGGEFCEKAFTSLVDAASSEFRAHDPLIQALAFHYHFGAMHPFEDGNGRTARALEALMLRRAGLKDTLFVSMSNYYYDEKDNYLAALSAVRQSNFDLTQFILFGLKGVAVQCGRLLSEINTHVAKSLYRDVMFQMYNRLLSTRKRALAQRQLAILDRLLDLSEAIEYRDLYSALSGHYAKLKKPRITYVRDLNHLIGLNAIDVAVKNDEDFDEQDFMVKIRLKWGTEITRTDFYKRLDELPKAKTRLMVSPKL